MEGEQELGLRSSTTMGARALACIREGYVTVALMVYTIRMSYVACVRALLWW